MKTQLLASVLGIALLAGSGLALADKGRGRDQSGGPSYHHRYDGPRQAHGPRRHDGPPPHAYRHHRQHGHHWHGPRWRHQHYHHHSYAPKHYGRYDDGVTIIFKGHFD